MTLATTHGEADVDEAAVRLGSRVRELRKARGLTLVALAEATDLSHPFLSQVERGLANLSLQSLRRLALALETSPVELVAAVEQGPAPRRVEVVRSGSRRPTAEGFARGTATSLVRGSRPFTPIVVRGRVVEWLEGDAAWEIIDRISVKYIGAPYSRELERVVAVIEPERQTVGVR